MHLEGNHASQLTEVGLLHALPPPPCIGVGEGNLMHLPSKLMGYLMSILIMHCSLSLSLSLSFSPSLLLTGRLLKGEEGDQEEEEDEVEEEEAGWSCCCCLEL